MVPFGALPAFDTGFYGLVAASIVWLFLCTGLSAAVLFSGLLAVKAPAPVPIYDRISLTILAFAALTAVPMLYSGFPMLILLGSPQSGKGVLWFVAGATFIATARLACRRPWAAEIIVGAAIAVVAGISGLHLFIKSTGTELLLRGGDSYAYLGLLLPFVPWLIASPARRRYYFAIACLVAVLCIVFTGNRAAAGIFLSLFVAFFLVRAIPKVEAWLSRLSFPVFFVAVLALMLCLSYALIAIDFRAAFDSIDSRILIAKIAIASVIDSSALEWITGHGWGSTQAAFYRDLTESGASLLDNRWDFLWRDIFHSHNIALELTYETGLLGLLAFAALLAGLIYKADSARRLPAIVFVVGYVVMNSVWFEYAHTVPILALAVAALAGKGTAQDEEPVAGRFVGGAVAAAIFVSCLAASAALYDFARQIVPFRMQIDLLPRKNFPVESFPDDPRGNDFIRASAYRAITRRINSALQAEADYVPATTVLSAILDDIEARIVSTRNPDLLLVGLVIFNDGHYAQPREWIKAVVERRTRLWDKLAERHLELAPKRTDVLVAYLSWQIANNRTAKARKLISRIRLRDPAEPVGLYFQGVLETRKTTQDGKQQGLTKIAQAVENGVERYLKVPDWLKKMAADAKSK